MNLIEQIQESKHSVVAVGIILPPNRVNILGSGFAVDSNGTILSAAHLLNGLDAAALGNMAVMVAEREEGSLVYYKWVPARILRRDDSEDAAVLQIDASNTLLKPVSLGDTTNVKEGQDTYFLGFPYAANLINEGLGITLIANRGMVSSVKRKSIQSNPLDWFIVDAISNPGNSGCPLFDSETNKVIGIMSISFRTKSQVQPTLDIREPMHIAGAKPIDYARALLTTTTTASTTV